MPRNKLAKPVGESRAKKASDEIYNARRRAKRAAARIEREAKKQGLTGKQKQATESYVASLREHIQKTYAKKGQPQEAAKRAARALDVQTLRKGTQTAAQRKNVIFERQLNLAGMGQQSTIAKTPEAGQAAVKIFYKATQNIWQGLPAADRNKAIMAKLGVSTLQEAFQEVLRQNPEAFRAALTTAKPVQSTDEAEFMEEESITSEDFGSPDYLSLVGPVEAARGE